jgi:periplasmic divalent cation tolerance protein
MDDLSICFVTAPSPEEARSLARSLLEERLVACVNLVPSVQSLYWWEGSLEEAWEVLLVLKTRTDRVPDLVDRVKELHSYSVPEVVSWPLGPGNPDYLRWVATEAAPLS